jgi:hypothetical protein
LPLLVVDLPWTYLIDLDAPLALRNIKLLLAGDFAGVAV